MKSSRNFSLRFKRGDSNKILFLRNTYENVNERGMINFSKKRKKLDFKKNLILEGYVYS